MRRKPSKAKIAAFQKAVSDAIGRAADKVDLLGGLEWRLPTKYGVDVSVSTHCSDDSSVFIRFLDRRMTWEEARQTGWYKDLGGTTVMSCSPNGKWNIHSFDSAASLKELERRLEILKPIEKESV